MLLLKHSPRLLAFCLLAKISTAAAIDPLRVGGSSQNLIFLSELFNLSDF